MIEQFHSELECPLCHWGIYDMPMESAIAFLRDHLRVAHADEEPHIPDSELRSRYKELYITDQHKQ